MRCSFALALFTTLLITAAASQEAAPTSGSPTSAPNDAFWVQYWNQPRSVFTQQEDTFNQSMKNVTFPLDKAEEPTNAGALDDNARWLKDHPDVRFFIDGYASVPGGVLYNMSLSQKRADFVKEQLISRGVPESQIVNAVGWGQLYPDCVEQTDECWNRNQVVRFKYSAQQ